MTKLLLTVIFVLYSLGAIAGRAKIIDDPHEALAVRYQLIEDAKEEISISYFIFAEDRTALELLSLLRKKSRQGVRVRVLIDHLFNDIPRYLGTHLVSEGVEIKNFNVLHPLRIGRAIKYRMHDKMFIVDRKVVILGGRNIEDTYYGRAPKNYDDRDVYIEGNLAETAQDYYNNLWDAQHLVPFKTKATKTKKQTTKLATAIQDLDEHERLLSQKNISSFNYQEFRSQLETIDDMKLLHDEITPTKRKMTGTALNLYELMQKAQKEVLIDSPYLILTKEVQELLSGLIQRGVRVRILTNSLKATDGIIPQAAYIGQRKKIVGMGVELYEYFGEDSFHSKSLVIDGQIAVIGSFNFDPRSQNLNTETMSVFYDQELAQLLTESMDRSLLVSYRVDERGRPVGHDKKYPGVKLSKVILTKMIQFLVVPYTRGLL